MLLLKDIKKSFGGVKALQGVDLEVQAGEIHALLGENGAGKSTLMKVISGAQPADSGLIIFDKQQIRDNNPQLSQQHGVRIIYQEFSLVPELSVAENIFLGSYSGSWLNRNNLFQQARTVIEELGFVIEVSKKVGQLSIAEQQIVEIAKAMSGEARLLILDEPSAVLGTEEVKKLFALLRKLKEKGVAIIYISHHLDELLELSDRITVLKDGRVVATVATMSTDKDELVRLMVGKELAQLYPAKNNRSVDEKVILIDQLIHADGISPQSLKWKKGEILGVGGLVGAGRTELMESLFGLRPDLKSRILMEGRKLEMRSPAAAIRQGWGMVPEDRKRLGGALNLSILENISLANLRKVSNRWGFIRVRKEKKMVQQLVQQLQIRLGNLENPLRSLSGGNQQKVILAKWLNLDLKVLLIDEPTRGVDLSARAEIYQLIQGLADQGIYIMMVSSDMEELIGFSDRIMVMNKGRVQGILEKKDISEEAVLRLMIAVQ